MSWYLHAFLLLELSGTPYVPHMAYYLRLPLLAYRLLLLLLANPFYFLCFNSGHSNQDRWNLNVGWICLPGWRQMSNISSGTCAQGLCKHWSSLFKKGNKRAKIWWKYDKDTAFVVLVRKSKVLYRVKGNEVNWSFMCEWERYSECYQTYY